MPNPKRHPSSRPSTCVTMAKSTRTSRATSYPAALVSERERATSTSVSYRQQSASTSAASRTSALASGRRWWWRSGMRASAAESTMSIPPLIRCACACRSWRRAPNESVMLGYACDTVCHCPFTTAHCEQVSKLRILQGALDYIDHLGRTIYEPHTLTDNVYGDSSGKIGA